VPAAERRGVAGRAVLALTDSRHYALAGLRPGTRLATAARRRRVGTALLHGRTRWYLFANGSSRGVLRVRGGVIQQVGIADKALTRGHRAQRAFIESFS
jgi:hypothetical protein